MSYSAKTLSSLLKFVAFDGNDTENADEVTITTHKEEKNVLEKKPSVHLTSSLCFVYLRHFFREGGWLLEEGKIRQILLKNLDVFQGVTV